MKEFLKALAAWLDDPMTQSVLSALGIAMFFGAIERTGWLARDARDIANDAHERIDALEARLSLGVVR